ncbi:amino acid ABC transporter substrate-binding protein [Actinomycetes bacterium]|nr:amino acid ABC transporter substrate-binding protein [Actinomycetes bacterium]
MRTWKTFTTAGILTLTAVFAVGCGSSGGTTAQSAAPAPAAPESAAPSAPAAEPSEAAPAEPTTLLERIQRDGVLRVSTDPAYPPQSSFDEATGEWAGFDIDVATEIANRLGTTVQWETPSWDVLTAGNWNDRWDISVGSMTITDERDKVLQFTTPYYFTPAGVAVGAGSDITSIDQLSGKRVGVCGACTYEYYLNRTLKIPGFDFDFIVPEDIEVVTYDTDSTGIQDLALGRIDAMVSTVPTLEEAIKKGKKIALIGETIFQEPLSVATDRGSMLPSDTLVSEINSVIEAMRADGKLSELSMKWYGVDFTKGAGS